MSHHGREYEEDERGDFEPAYDQARADRDAAHYAIRCFLHDWKNADGMTAAAGRLQDWAIANRLVSDPDAKRKAAEKKLADARFAVMQAERDLKAVKG